MIAPLTGAFAAQGGEMVNGAKLAVDEINAAGGVAGYKLEVVVGDVQNGSADQVTTAVERLFGDRDVNAIVTGYASASSFEIEMMAEQNMPYLLEGNSNATRDIIAPHPEKYPTVWEANGSFDPYNTDLVPLLQGLEASGKLKLPNKKVALIASDNPYSKVIMNGLKASFEGVGWTVSSADVVPFGEIGDWRTFLVKVRQDNPSIIINTDYPVANGAKFLTQFLEQPTDSLVFIQFAPSIPVSQVDGQESDWGYLQRNRRRDELAQQPESRGGLQEIHGEVRYRTWYNRTGGLRGSHALRRRIEEGRRPDQATRYREGYRRDPQANSGRHSLL